MRLILAQAIKLFVYALEILLWVRIIMSFVRPRGWSRESQWFFRLEELVFRATEPFLAPIRNILPMSSIGLDFSPFILFILLDIARRLLLSLIFSLPI